MSPLERKTRKDRIREKVLASVFEHLQDEDYTRFDSNQGKVTVQHPQTGEEVSVHKRIWLNVNKEQQHGQYLLSDQYEEFQDENNGATVSYGIWHEALSIINSFVSDPKPESCVDEKISGLMHAMAALLG